MDGMGWDGWDGWDGRLSLSASLLRAPYGANNRKTNVCAICIICDSPNPCAVLFYMGLFHGMTLSMFCIKASAAASFEM